MADGTTLNPATGGDVIATEDIVPGASRGDGALPLTDYKLPRTKIALGSYDQDTGDVSAMNALAVRNYLENQLLEQIELQSSDSRDACFRGRSGERANMIDRRGSTGRGSSR